jgi:RNA polymerase sigma factor (sigma-70 family)
MAQDNSFLELIGRVRAGDQHACAELVRIYEPSIRMAVRLRLHDGGLRRLFDSMDVCQSVLGNFFVRAALGQFDLDRPDQLIRLLVTMARNRVTNHALQQRAARRDYRRTGAHAAEAEIVADDPSPSQIVADKELLDVVRSRLSPEEAALAELRAAGKGWAEIAAAIGDSPDAVRMRFGRALDRITRELRLGHSDSGCL